MAGELKRYRVALVGNCCTHGEFVAAALKAEPGAELAAVSTTRQESADEAAKQFGAQHAFDDHRKMLELDDVDTVAVVVTLPHH